MAKLNQQQIDKYVDSNNPVNYIFVEFTRKPYMAFQFNPQNFLVTFVMDQSVTKGDLTLC